MLDAAGFCDLLRSPLAHARLADEASEGAVVIDLATGPPVAASAELAGLADLADLADGAAATPCVLVGVRPRGSRPGPGPGGRSVDARVDARVDVLVDVLVDDDAADEVLAAIGAHPQAAAALALLLRGASSRSVAAGLVAESSTYSVLQAGPEFRAWLAGRPGAPASAPATSGPPQVLVDRDGAVLRLTLSRPGRHNAFSARMRDELVAGLTIALADDTVDQVLINGQGPSFCSGGDLAEFGTAPDPATAHLIRLARSPALALASLAPRVEVRVHGACIGAGIELPAFAGRVVAHPDAWFQLPEVGFGLVPGAGGTVSITRRIGRQQTALLAITGRVIDAATAMALGLVDRLS